MRRGIFAAWLLMSGACLVGCGTHNQADPYTTKTKDEQARAALDANQYGDAVALYEELVEAEPDAYERYPLLAASLAGLAGMDLVSLAEKQVSGGSGLLEQVSAFLPSGDSTDFMTHMEHAVKVLQSMPEDHRSAASTYEYAASANFQLAVYSVAVSVMTVRRFIDTTNNQYDPEKLASMTADEAAAFISGLEGAIDSVEGGGIGQTVGQGADEVLTAINNTPGDTLKDKVSQYLAHQNQ